MTAHRGRPGAALLLLQGRETDHRRQVAHRAAAAGPLATAAADRSRTAVAEQATAATAEAAAACPDDGAHHAAHHSAAASQAQARTAATAASQAGDTAAQAADRSIEGSRDAPNKYGGAVTHLRHWSEGIRAGGAFAGLGERRGVGFDAASARQPIARHLGGRGKGESVL